MKKYVGSSFILKITIILMLGVVTGPIFGKGTSAVAPLMGALCH
ncbi:hypothetical protein [Jeotgalibacillus proteolyticus]|nr:hypothetical protein [Jeotgalibacillus proteolyticus]